MQTLSLAELDGQHGELLPAREAMDWINVTNVTAVNVAIAVNAASPGAEAEAWANQFVKVSQD